MDQQNFNQNTVNNQFNQSSQPSQQNNPNGQPLNPYTIDYLNQIAPKPVEPFWTKNKIILAIFTVFALIFSLFLFITQSGKTDSARESLLRSYYNIEKTRDITKKYQPKLRDSELSAINTGLIATFSSEESKFKTHLESKKIKPLTDSEKKNNQKYKQIDKDYQDLDTKLDDAYLNATLDEAYAREMSFHLNQLKVILKTTKTRDNSKSTDKIIDEIVQNIDTSIKQIENYNATSK